MSRSGICPRISSGSAFSSSPATADGLVYAGCDDNNIYALRG
jgi:hypothetical protein